MSNQLFSYIQGKKRVVEEKVKDMGKWLRGRTRMWDVFHDEIGIESKSWH